MDENDINDIIKRCALLKHGFLDALAAKIFSQKLKLNKFLIVNATIAESIGTQWLILCQKEDQLFFAHPLGKSYKDVYRRKFALIEIAKTYHLLND